MKEIHKALKNNNWRQGSCLYIEIGGDLIKKGKLESGLYIIITQDCDLLHPNIKEEPCAELIYAERICNPDGNYVGGNNPRKIHMPVKIDGDVYHYECHAKNKITIPKEYLLNLSPSAEYILEDNIIKSLIKWIIKRYDRTAFPYAFNEMLGKKNIKEIKNIVKKYTADIHHGVFLKLSTYKELVNDESYAIEKLYILVENSVTDAGFSALEDDLEEITRIIDGCDNINIVGDYQVKKLNDISVADYFDLDSWDFEYLSFRD